MASVDIIMRSFTTYLQGLTLREVSRLGKELGAGAYGKVFTVQYREITYAAKEIHSILIHAASREGNWKIKLQKIFFKSVITAVNFVTLT